MQAVITDKLGEDLREWSEVAVCACRRAEKEGKLRVLFLDGGGNADTQDYEGGGGGSVRLSACARDLACSLYLANAAVTKATQTKQVWEVRTYSIVCCICYVPHTRTLLNIKSPSS